MQNTFQQTPKFQLDASIGQKPYGHDLVIRSFALSAR